MRLEASLGIRSALRVFARSCSDLYDKLFLLVGVGVLWLALSAPVITIGPASAGVYCITHHLVRGEGLEFRLFCTGFRRYFFKSWQILLPTVFIGLLIVANIYLYATFLSGLFRTFMVSLWIWALVFWLGVQVYVPPLLIHQEDKNILLIFRNAVLITLRAPLFSLSLVGLLLLTVVIIGVFMVPLILIAMPLISIIENKALLTFLEHS